MSSAYPDEEPVIISSGEPISSLMASLTKNAETFRRLQQACTLALTRYFDAAKTTCGHMLAPDAALFTQEHLERLSSLRREESELLEEYLRAQESLLAAILASALETTAAERPAGSLPHRN